MQYSTSLLLLLAGAGYAFPGSSASSLRPRAGGVEWDESCDVKLVTNTTWGAAGFTTMKDVVEAAYADTLVLARKARTVAADDTGYAHYFNADHHETFKKMMTSISDEQHFSIKFSCVAKVLPGGGKVCGPDTLMVTDASPGKDSDRKTITACPKFFTGETNYRLYSKDRKTPSPPYRDIGNTTTSWCEKIPKKQGEDGLRSKKDVKDFVTIGHTLLHELTHLDSLGRSADVPRHANDKGDMVSGTDDLGSPDSPETARKVLAELKDDTPPEKRPTCNAESFAAAATEIYFVELCRFSEIGPKVAEKALAPLLTDLAS